MIRRDAEYLSGLIHELRRLPRETEWVEFKHNKDNPQEVGEYISALANSVALVGKSFAYMVWGVDNETHQVVGTQFVPAMAKVGNEELESWLFHSLSPKVDFVFYELNIDG